LPSAFDTFYKRRWPSVPGSHLQPRLCNFDPTPSHLIPYDLSSLICKTINNMEKAMRIGRDRQGNTAEIRT